MDNDDVASEIEPQEEENSEEAVHPAHSNGFSLHYDNPYTPGQFQRIQDTLPGSIWGVHVIRTFKEANRHRIGTYDRETKEPLARRDKSIIFQEIAGGFIAALIGLPVLAVLAFLVYAGAVGLH